MLPRTSFSSKKSMTSTSLVSATDFSQASGRPTEWATARWMPWVALCDRTTGTPLTVVGLHMAAPDGTTKSNVSSTSLCSATIDGSSGFCGPQEPPPGEANVPLREALGVGLHRAAGSRGAALCARDRANDGQGRVPVQITAPIGIAATQVRIDERSHWNLPASRRASGSWHLGQHLGPALQSLLWGAHSTSPDTTA
jgi:hypothetical protein